MNPPPTSDVQLVRIARLQPGPALRPVNDGHVESLTELVDVSPPILVETSSWAVIDGAHRVEAARRAGRTAIRAQLQHIPPEQRLATAVRLNRTHVLPLTMEQRKQVAQQLLQADPQQSNGEVARLVGVSPSTIRRLRPDDGPVIRIGVDGKRYPQDRAARRQAAEQLLRRHPGWPARRIARQVQLSPTTVNKIRAEIEARPPRPRPLPQVVRRAWRWIVTTLRRTRRREPEPRR